MKKQDHVIPEKSRIRESPEAEGEAAEAEASVGCKEQGSSTAKEDLDDCESRGPREQRQVHEGIDFVAPVLDVE